MRNVISSRKIIAPMLGIGTELDDFSHIVGVERVIIFSLGKKNVTESALSIYAAQFLIKHHKGIVFSKHIEGIALLCCADKLYTVCHSGVILPGSPVTSMHM